MTALIALFSLEAGEIQYINFKRLQRRSTCGRPLAFYLWATPLTRNPLFSWQETSDQRERSKSPER